LLPNLIAAYKEIFAKLGTLSVEWVQLDEPILTLDLPMAWQNAFKEAYEELQNKNLKVLLTTYFGGLEDNIKLACKLPISGLHIDAVRAPKQIPDVLECLDNNTIFSIGIINGRNVWKTDLDHAINLLQPLKHELGDRLWIGGSCSFLHAPVDLESEKNLNPEIKQWLAFARQKTKELTVLADALNRGVGHVEMDLLANKKAISSKVSSTLIHNQTVKTRHDSIDDIKLDRTPFSVREKIQNDHLKLPLFPTTTIGSFPQTSEIRSLRVHLKNSTLSIEEYNNEIKKIISMVIKKQEEIGLDVLVHGEPERNDMVEYFGEHLDGFAFTQNGWIQSYGSRCVKPPIIYGDVQRTKPITVEWISYAQSLSDKPVKGMLTGPVTMLMWSFVRDDQPIQQTAEQIALALRDEVKDLEQAGISVIQIDEPAFREGLPLRQRDWNVYLNNAIRCFKLVSSCVEDKTQIHTHMCYSEFNDIIEAIANLDADVLSIESCRSHMEILEAFKEFSYPNEIGPGVYDIHSPQIPETNEMKELLDKAATQIPHTRLWVNPDCGLKTRNWHEAEASLINMVRAAQRLRAEYSKNLAK
jgi:5-methyltetrahydropteroyltriglutamate--homocysteine methyltransferase